MGAAPKTVWRMSWRVASSSIGEERRKMFRLVGFETLLVSIALLLAFLVSAPRF